MGYVLAGLIVVAIVATAVTLLVLSARRHGRRQPQASGDEDYGAGIPGSDTAIVAADRDSPLGDTSEHAGRQRDGETVAGQDADRSGGSRRPVNSGATGAGEGTGQKGSDAPHVAPPVVGGEGEGRRRIPDGT
jgi:hypothetical protein